MVIGSDQHTLAITRGKLTSTCTALTLPLLFCVAVRVLNCREPPFTSAVLMLVGPADEPAENRAGADQITQWFLPPPQKERGRLIFVIHL